MNLSKFPVGAKVLVCVSYHYGLRLSPVLREDRVFKEYKNGNVVLEGDQHPRQQYGPGGWARGDGSYRPHLVLADSEEGRQLLERDAAATVVELLRRLHDSAEKNFRDRAPVDWPAVRKAAQEIAGQFNAAAQKAGEEE